MTRREYRCPRCHLVQEVEATLHETAHLHCPQDGALMHRYFGNSQDILINYGYRESRYTNEADARIAQFQFTNL